LSALLAQVRYGETIVIVDRGWPVARWCSRCCSVRPTPG